MAGAMFVGLILCPRVTTFLVRGKTCNFVKRTAVLSFQSGQRLKEHILRRSIHLSRKTLPKVSQTRTTTTSYQQYKCDNISVFLSTTNCRLLGVSLYIRSSHTNSASTNSFGVSPDAIEHVKHNINDSKSKTEEPSLKDLSENDLDLDNELSEVSEEIISEDDPKQATTPVTVSNTPEHLLNSKHVKSKDSDFEYDYQVAGDIEDYDYIDENVLMNQQIRPEKVLPISLERGKDGVFDLDEIVTLLTHLGAEDIVTFPVPPEANFCDHMVVVSAKSSRHLQAINDELLWVHKRKKSKSDPHLVIEGKNKSTWCAMDIGNIVLHVFFGKEREYYDIESLWTLGPDNDPKCQKQHNDPYALSPEDLFWLEAGKTAGQANKGGTDKYNAVKSASIELDVSKKSEKLPDDITNSDANQEISKST